MLRPFLTKYQALLSRCLEKIYDASFLQLHDPETEESGGAAVPARECYACTQSGVPAFHSTTCDRANSPEWEASAGSSLIPIQPISQSNEDDLDNNSNTQQQRRWRRRRIRSRWVLDPRSSRVQRLNRGLILARAVALALDPLFFYSLSVNGGWPPCLSLNWWLAASVTALRTAADLLHLVHIGLQLRLAYVSRESLVVGCGKLVWDARMVAEHYLRSLKGFWFDLFVILPIPQIVFWIMAPKFMEEEDVNCIMIVLLVVFLFQFLPKVYHIICMMRRMQKVTGLLFGSIWWGFGLNLIAYFIASHVAGGCWYVLTIQRIASCLKQQCEKYNNCSLLSLSCSKELCSHLPLQQLNNVPCGSYNLTSNPVRHDLTCIDINGSFRYGIYSTGLPVVFTNSLPVKVLYPIFWGLFTLSTFGNNLEPTSHWLEVVFSITMVLSGLMLFTLLIGNIQVFLHAVMARRRKMQLRCRDLEWWMRRRQLSSQLRQRVRLYEWQRWETTRGEDEMEMIRYLPLGLRRDIKRYLCFDLIKQVPLFHNLDDLILDNICDRAEPLVFSKNEKVIREGDPVQRMVFVVKGSLQSRQQLSKGAVATCMLGAGGFFGDELLSWCLRRPFLDRLPASSATFVCIEPTQAFGLDAPHLRYITEHFRYKFANEKLKRTARFYSANWRTWAAVNIQLAWRRYKARTGGTSGRSIDEASETEQNERRLRRYAAMFMSLRPHDHLE